MVNQVREFIDPAHAGEQSWRSFTDISHSNALLEWHNSEHAIMVNYSRSTSRNWSHAFLGITVGTTTDVINRIPFKGWQNHYPGLMKELEPPSKLRKQTYPVTCKDRKEEHAAKDASTQHANSDYFKVSTPHLLSIKAMR